MRKYLTLLLLLVIAALAVAAPITAQVTATPIPNSGVIIIATAIPGPTPIPLQANGCYAPLSLPIGGQVVLLGGINVRNMPTVSSALVNYYPSAVTLTVIEGPVCADGFNWWHVSGNGEPGWVVEGKPGRYFLQPLVDPNTTNCAAPLDTIQAGGQVRIVTGSRLRQTPDENSLVVTVVQPGAVLDVIEGPRCYKGLNWWRVRAPFGNTSTLVNGWIAEGYPDGYYVEGLGISAQAAVEQAFCFAPLRLHAGTRAAVTYRDGVSRRLRAAPSTSAGVVAELIDGIAFDVIDDTPVCADHFNWWQVRIVPTGLTGWLAEGRPGNYWFDVLVN